MIDKSKLRKIQEYAISEMSGDVIHDSLHIDRVLCHALTIAHNLNEIDNEVLIVSCWLHDIGRKQMESNSQLCHAAKGSEIAYIFLKQIGLSECFCIHVRDCMATHRFRTNNIPTTLEAKILYDADKLDAIGALGIARSMIHIGRFGHPIYTIDNENKVEVGVSMEKTKTFFYEYQYKLSNIFDSLYTDKAKELAIKRKMIMEEFYNALLAEIAMDGIDPITQLWFLNTPQQSFGEYYSIGFGG